MVREIWKQKHMQIPLYKVRSSVEMPKINLYGESIDTRAWNPLVVSIYYGNLNIVQFFMENDDGNIRFSLTADCD